MVKRRKIKNTKNKSRMSHPQAEAKILLEYLKPSSETTVRLEGGLEKVVKIARITDDVAAVQLLPNSSTPDENNSSNSSNNYVLYNLTTGHNVPLHHTGEWLISWASSYVLMRVNPPNHANNNEDNDAVHECLLTISCPRQQIISARNSNHNNNNQTWPFLFNK